MTQPVSFLTFFLVWARRQRWEVPLLHVRMCQWLDTCDAPERVMMVFRGAAKSTIYAIWKAYKLYKNRANRSLIWAADDKLATKLTRDTLNVLRHHPLCAGMLPRKPGAQSFWVTGSVDARNPSMEAVGVGSNATGSRADDIDFDDIEVPKNIKTPEARLNLRLKIDDSTHIAVPGSQSTYIGTPHTHASIYTELEEGGAAMLKIPLFAKATRYTDTLKRARYRIGFEPDEDGLYVLVGIHKHAKLLKDGVDYHVEGGEVVFPEPPGVGLMDFYSGCAWPERFNRIDIERRRKRTRTINGWDSQYQLQAKPLDEVRLDPSRILAYDIQPVERHANGETSLWLGKQRLVGAAGRWDPASGKLKSDVSAFAGVYQDEVGRRYLHRVAALIGEIAEFASDGKTIVGGQVWQLCDHIQAMNLPKVTVETNGIGSFAPAVLRAAIKQRKLRCSVVPIASVKAKNIRILEAIEPLLLARGMLWAHADVLQGDLWDQMKEWNPAVADQDDDLIDASAGAIEETPERFKGKVEISTAAPAQDWRPEAGTFEVTFER